MSTDTNTTAKTKAGKTVQRAAGEADSGIRNVTRKAEEVLHDGVEIVRTRGAAYVDEAGRRLDEAQVYAREKVREHPMTTVLAAAGVGMIIGLLIGSGRR